jgi:hypothetical protein
MDKEFYVRKIRQLTDDKLKELLELRTKDNLEIINLAEQEALKRGIDITPIESRPNRQNNTKSKKDKEFSWAKFLLYFIPEP